MPRSSLDVSGVFVDAVCSSTAEASGKSQSLPREAAASWESPGQHLAASVKSRCASVDLMLMQPTAPPSPTATPIDRLQGLISQKLQVTERLLTEARGEGAGPTGGVESDVERLVAEARAAWTQAREVLEEVKELRALYQQLAPPPTV